MIDPKYNMNTGLTPRIDDTVEICHTGSIDGRTGVLAGMVDNMNYCAIVILDERLEDGTRAISIPVVCLKLI